MIVPIQFFGLGDICYTQTLIRKLAQGDKILWPVEKQFVDGLSRAYPDIYFIDRKLANFPYDCRETTVDEETGVTTIPLRWCDTNLKVPYKDCMKAKYGFFGYDYRTWKEQAMWTRDTKREELLYDMLVPKDKPYVLANQYFGSDSSYTTPISVIRNELPVVHIKTRPGFSLFDYGKIIEDAAEIHVASSSIFYILELLELKAKEVHIYARKPLESNLETIEYLMDKHKYIQHL